jgi:hypothetical protein
MQIFPAIFDPQLVGSGNAVHTDMGPVEMEPIGMESQLYLEGNLFLYQKKKKHLKSIYTRRANYAQSKQKKRKRLKKYRNRKKSINQSLFFKW